METIVNLKVDNQTAQLFDFYTKRTGNDISKMFEIYMLNLISNELSNRKTPEIIWNEIKSEIDKGENEIIIKIKPKRKAKKPIKRMTLQEYNSKLEEAEQAYENGEYFTQSEVEKQFESWKKQKIA